MLLPAQVPVHLTYAAAVATKRGTAFREAVYGRDGQAPPGNRTPPIRAVALAR